MNFQPLVTICLPIYNPNREYFMALIDNIANQTYKNMQIVISDDAECPFVADLISSDNRFQYIKNEGKHGIFENLNHAFDFSCGDYIQIICQDDLFEPNFIEKQLAIICSSLTIGFVYSQAHAINSRGTVISRVNGEGHCIIPKEQLPRHFFLWGCIPGSLSTVMLTKTAWIKNGRFREDLKFGGDFDYWIRLAENFDLGVNFEPTAYIRVHDESASSTLLATQYVKDMMVNYKVIYDRFEFPVVKKYIYLNAFVSSSNLVRLIRDIQRGRISVFSIFMLSGHPFSLFLAIFFIVFSKLKIDLRKRFVFGR